MEAKTDTVTSKSDPRRRPWISPVLLVEEVGRTANDGGNSGDGGQHGTDS
jgi:hypothetical protein